MFSVNSQLLSMMILVRLRDVIDKVLREEQCGFRKRRGCIGQIFTLSCIIEKYMNDQILLVIIVVDYEQAFDSANRTVLTKVLSCMVLNIKAKKSAESRVQH